MDGAPSAPGAASPEDAVRHAVGSARLEGIEVPEEFIPVLEAVARGARSADDVVAELIANLRR